MAAADAAEVGDSKTEKAEQIQVLARQWAWEFRYGNGADAVSSTELHLPNNRRIKLVLHSEDVLHGLYIPAFRVKQDVIPGRDIDFEFTNGLMAMAFGGFFKEVTESLVEAFCRQAALRYGAR